MASGAAAGGGLEARSGAEQQTIAASDVQDPRPPAEHPGIRGW
ncbi:MAG TPA: hypothetical protein VEX66_11010 [Microlunatus sp.]|nr:hypothetical protein [Microlunatus sp.]